MKIKLSLLLLIFTFFFTNLNAQNTTFFRIIYKANQCAQKNNDTFNITDTMSLDVDQFSSVYYDRNLSFRDSVNNRNFLSMKSFSFSSNQDELEKRLEMKGKADQIIGDREGETARFFKNRTKNEIITIEREPNDLEYKFAIIEILIHDWAILSDTTSILNYTCIKATTHFRGREYIAWFTKDIPINEGPWKLYGLPGLILKVEDSENIFSIQAIGIEKISSIRYPMPDKISNFEKITYQELNKLKRAQYSKIGYGFYDGQSSIQYFNNIKNPVIYPEMELD